MGVSTFSGTVNDFDAALVDGAARGRRADRQPPVTKDENLSAHLLAPDFFDAERSPRFASLGRSRRATATLSRFDGEVTLKGVSQPATLRGTITGPVSDPYGKQRLGLKLETTIDRTAFGINWNARHARRQQRARQRCHAEGRPRRW